MDKEKRSMPEPAKKDEGGAENGKKPTEPTEIDKGSDEKTLKFDRMFIIRDIAKFLLSPGADEWKKMENLPLQVQSSIKKIVRKYDEAVLNKDDAKEKIEKVLEQELITNEMLRQFLRDNMMLDHDDEYSDFWYD